MANSTDITSQSKRESLNPVSNENRLFGLTTYITLWISSMVVIQFFWSDSHFYRLQEN
ncbi:MULTISPECIES: hypothetical protein [Bacillaceae]|uniref:hypothetical protein n=1 Tax=Bacillaceae TaxID=186817 RepID=UPI002FFE6A40